MKQLADFTDIELAEALNRSYQTFMAAQQDIQAVNAEIERRKVLNEELKKSNMESQKITD